MVSINLLKKHSFSFIILFTILISLAIGYIVSYIPSIFMIVFLVPVFIIVMMHYLGLYGLKKRLLSGLFIILLAAIVVTAAEAQVYYSSDHIINDKFSNDVSASTQVTPFSGVYSAYNYSITVTNYKNIPGFNATLTIKSATYNRTLTYSELSHFVRGDSITVYYVAVANSLPYGVYNYTYTFGNYSIVAPGPINANLGTWLDDALPFSSILYFVYYEIIFLAGVFVLRSFEHSRSYSKK